jgi:HEAT repeat protein
MPVDDLQTMLAQVAVLNPAAPDWQFEAAIALPKMAGPANRAAIVVALRGALTAAHSLTRAHAAEGLGLLQAAEAQPDLIHALKDRYQLVRSYAARALGKIGDHAAIEPLIAVLSGDSFFGARAEAAEALRYLCGGDDSPAKRKARAALKQHQETALQRKDERSRRVLAEIDLSLKELGDLTAKIDAALKQGKSEYLAAMLSDWSLIAHRAMDRLGGLTQLAPG